MKNKWGILKLWVSNINSLIRVHPRANRLISQIIQKSQWGNIKSILSISNAASQQIQIHFICYKMRKFKMQILNHKTRIDLMAATFWSEMSRKIRPWMYTDWRKYLNNKKEGSGQEAASVGSLTNKSDN